MTSDSPLIRTKIEEIEVEEWQGTTSLFPELWGIDLKTSGSIGGETTLNRTLSIDSKCGKLLGVALVDKEILQNYSEQILKKESQNLPFKNPIIVHQVPISIEKKIADSVSINQSAKVVLKAIKNQISSPVELNRQNNMEAAKSRYSALISEPKRRKVDPQNKMEDNILSSNPIDSYGQMQSEYNDTNDEVLQSRFKNKRNQLTPKKNKAKNIVKIDPENGEIEWLNPTQRMNWKQKKGRDRNLLDLTERIIARTNQNETPTREMVISFLASLSALQLEFIEELIDGFSSGQLPKPNESANSSIAEGGVNPDNNKAVNQGNSIEKKEIGNEVSLQETLIPRKITETKGLNLVDPILMPQDLEDYIEISEEEKILQLKILEYQKKHDVSYDYAASVILK